MSALNRPIVTEVAPGRWLLQTSCHECFIDVQAGENVPDSRWIAFELLSTHNGRYEGRLRTRLRYAWRVLRGQGWPAFELNTQEETDGLLWALYEARRRAFGPPPPDVVFNAGPNANATSAVLVQLGCQGCGSYFWSMIQSGDRQPLFCGPCMAKGNAKTGEGISGPEQKAG